MLGAFHISVHMEASFWEMYQHQTWTSDLQSLETEEIKMRNHQLQFTN